MKESNLMHLAHRASLSLTLDLQAWAKLRGVLALKCFDKEEFPRVRGQGWSVYGPAILSRGVIPVVLGHLDGNTSTIERYCWGHPRQPQKSWDARQISMLLSPKLFTLTGGEDSYTYSRKSILSLKRLETLFLRYAKTTYFCNHLWFPRVRNLAALAGWLHRVKVDDNLTSILGSCLQLLMVLLWFTHHTKVWESDYSRKKAEIQEANLLRWSLQGAQGRFDLVLDCSPW